MAATVPPGAALPAERPDVAHGIVLALGAWVALGGLLSILGWAIDRPRLTDWAGTGISIQPNGALAAMLAGLALVLGAWGQRLVAAAGGVAVAVIGGATALQHIAGIDLGIDQLLGFERPWGDAITVAPGRMGLPASVAWVLGGSAVALAQFGRTQRYVSPLGLAIIAIAALGLTGYVFNAGVLFSLPRWTAISLQTGSFLLGTGIAVIASTPGSEPMRTLVDDSSAGLMVRRTLPFIVVLPLVLGLLRIWGQRLGLYGSATGTALLVLTLSALLAAVLWGGAMAVRRRERELAVARRARTRADRARRVSEGRTAALLENIPDAFASFDADWRYTYLNGAAERAIGKMREEVLGRRLWDVFPALGTEFETRIRRAAATGATEEFEGFNPVVGRWFSNRAYPTPDGGVAVYFRDLTNARRAEAELKLTTDHAEVMLAHVDAEGRYLFVNTPYAARFGLTREEVVGRTLPEVVGKEAHARLAHHIQTVLSGQPVTFEMEIPYATGGSQFMHVAYTPEHDGQGRVIGLVAAIINITERKHAEDALRDADRRKDEFLATLSHELRNPLAPITNCIEILRRGIPDPQLAGKTLATLERQVRHMVRLVDDLLDVSRITRNTLTLRKQPVRLSAVLVQAIEAFQPQADAREQHVAVQIGPAAALTVDGDRVRLVQIVGNLLSNAGRYSARGSRISVTARQEAGDAIITVADEGIGIAPGMLQTIFEPFTQLHPEREQSQGGLGVGLSLARRLAELHGGSLEAFSSGDGTGSQFALRLPCVS